MNTLAEDAEEDGCAAPPPAPWICDESIWQEVESGSYRVDLPVWERIVADVTGPVLDLGCGTGRVARHLARKGLRVIGIERDPGIAADFNRLAGGMNAEAEVADVLDLESAAGRDRFDAILAPQQLVQVLGGAPARRCLLKGVAARLAPGGLVAFALVPSLPDRSTELDHLPDLLEIGGWVYSSRPVSIEAGAHGIEVTRLRSRVSPGGELAESTRVTRFDRLPTEVFERELCAASLKPVEIVPLPATEEHVGSLVVIARRDRH